MHESGAHEEGHWAYAGYVHGKVPGRQVLYSGTRAAARHVIAPAVIAALAIVACGSAAVRSSSSAPAAGPPGSTQPTAVSTSSPPPSPSPSASPRAGESACLSGVRGPWPLYCTVFGPLPSGVLPAHLARIDRAFWLAYNEVVYTKGVSHRWERYVTPELAAMIQQSLLPQQIAAARGHEGTERIYRTTVSPMPDFPGNMMVDFCINDARDHPYDLRTGKVLPRDPQLDGYPMQEEQDSLSRVNGIWKINTIDAFTATRGHPLAGETGMCF